MSLYCEHFSGTGATLGIDSQFHVGEVALASGNPSEAYRCFSSVLEGDSSRWEAWAGKAKAAGWMSTLADYRWREMEACIKTAIELCPADERSGLASALASETVSVAIAVHNLAHKNYNEHGGMALPESFGLGILTKAKPYQPVIDTYFIIVTEAILACSNAIAFAEKQGAVSKDLYLRMFSMARNVFVNSVITVEGADSGWNTISCPFPEDKVAFVSAVVDRLLPAARKLDSTIPDPRQQAAQAQEEANKAAACFIATAALGTSVHPELDSLRAYRDNVLMNSQVGRRFVGAYYRLSPPVAVMIAKSSMLRAIALTLIVRPSVRWARKAVGAPRGSPPR